MVEIRIIWNFIVRTGNVSWKYFLFLNTGNVFTHRLLEATLLNCRTGAVRLFYHRSIVYCVQQKHFKLDPLGRSVGQFSWKRAFVTALLPTLEFDANVSSLVFHVDHFFFFLRGVKIKTGGAVLKIAFKHRVRLSSRKILAFRPKTCRQTLWCGLCDCGTFMRY